MTTVENWLKTAEHQLKSAGITNPRLDALIMLETATGRRREWLLAHGDEPISQKLGTRYFKLVARRASRVPLVHLTGKREFYGLELNITPHVLTPRAESETIAELAIKHTPRNGRLIDIGTGSGALAIAIKKHRPDLEVWASEVSNTALEVARRNAKKHQTDIKFIQSDLWQNIKGRFDVITANLPYLKNDADLMPEVTKEPAVALFGGDDGLEIYRKFFTQLPDHLETGGYVFIESDPWQQAELIKLAAAAGLAPLWEQYFILGFKGK